MQALEKRDSDAAALAMRKHLGNARQYIEEKLASEVN